jgi:hypothetical protein
MSELAASVGRRLSCWVMVSSKRLENENQGEAGGAAHLPHPNAGPSPNGKSS